MVEILHNNYQIPIYSIEDQDNIIKIIHSKEFNDIYSFYASQIPAGSRLEQLPDYEKRMGFYLYYTGQDQFLSQVNNLLYKKHMPTIQEFLKDDAYMGNSYAIIYPYWRDVLAKIFDPSNQYFECVFRGSIGCLNGDTCILVDNKKVTLRDLAKKGSDYTFNVISFDIENNRLIQTKATNARVTGKNRKQISISLSDGTVINSTYDHRYLLSNNNYVHAEDLNIGDCIKSSNKSYIVIDIRYTEEKADVYDIEVPQYHNFGVLTKSGDLVFLHNSGKSTIARRGLIYSLYRICCLRSPHKLFNIAPDTVLSALMISVTLQQAQDTALKPVLEMIRNSPCFHEVRKMTSFDAFGPGDPVPFCRQGNGIRFPNNVYLSVGSNINHIIGYSVFGCFVGDTKVVTDKGDINIEDLSKDYKGCSVKALDLDGTQTWNNVVKCECTREVNKLIEIELENGSIIKCTTNHKFPVKNNPANVDFSIFLYEWQWCKIAEDLKAGDELFSETGYVKVKSVRNLDLNEKVKVYNLEVDHPRHNYLLSCGVFTCNSIFDEAEEKDSTEAFKLYTGLRERIRSRFLNSSLIYCALISSSKSKSGMVWEYIRKIKQDDPETLLLDPSIWEVKGDALGLSGKKFWIYIGTKTHPSKVLPAEYNDIPLEQLNYVPPAGCELLEVPIEYKREFENNIEAAIQNIAGRTTDTSDRPFDDLSKLGDCPQLLPEVHLEAPLGDQIPLIDKLPKELFQETTVGPRLARYPSAPRYCHVDLASQSSSQAGYSLWHKEYIVNEYGEHVTVFVADFISWISAPNRIDHDAIKQLSLDLRDKAGVYIKTISYDQFQCFTGDTKVSLLNGEEVSFKEILERFNNGEELYTYTLDLDNKKVVPGKIINAKNNGKKQIMKVVLDNGEEIKCTLDHRFMLRDGTFVQAKNLRSGDSLMPLYRKYSNKGYEIILNPLTNSWGLTYGKIANYMYGPIKGLHIHHKDFNKLNNNPSNLVLLTKEEHLKKHVDHFQDLLKADPNIWNKIREKSQTEEARKKRSIKCKKVKEKFYADKTKSAYARRRQSESGKLISTKYKQEMINCTKKSFKKDNCKRSKEQAERITVLNKTIKPRLGTKTTDIAIQNITRANLLKWKSPEYVAKMKVRYPGARGHLIKLFGKNYKRTVPLEIINEEKKKHREEWFKTHRINHKVKHIEILNEYDYVYDISIDKIQNFALSSGVFVHNSEYVRQSLQQNHEFENVKYQSVDRDITAYLNFAQWMVTGRIKIGDCPYLREQLGYIGVVDKKLLTTHKKDMADSCLSYDTKIFLLSGKVLTVEELYHSDVSHEWILACDCETKQLRPVHIERVLEKHIPETLIQFTLSNGKTFSCTDDHLILMKNGTYKRADEIEQFEEFMPFNYYHELNYHDRYRKVVNPFRKTSKFLYKIVSQELLSNAIQEAKNRAVIDGSKFTVIHHKSHNKNDDRPENLVPLTNIEHTNLHAMTGREIKAFHDRTVLKRQRSKIINEGLALMKQVNPEGYRRYLLKHDIADQLAEKKAKVENLSVYATQITRIENNKPVYDIVLNSIHNFALDCNIFVHNCVGAVNNAYLDTAPVEFPFVNTKTQEVKSEDSFIFDPKTQEVIEI